MLDYKTLDFIADLYVPLLLLALVVLMVRSIIATDWQRFRIEISLLFYGFIIVYGLMFSDQLFSIWPRLGLDYSTHTAIALMLVTLLYFDFSSFIQPLEPVPRQFKCADAIALEPMCSGLRQGICTCPGHLHMSILSESQARAAQLC